MSNIIVKIVGLIQIAFLMLFAAPVIYLLLLMVAAIFYRRPKITEEATNISKAEPEHFIILVPAHDEALTLPSTLVKIKQLQFKHLNQIIKPIVVVVADNCTDETATIARQADVIVYERFNPDLRGKGHALQWAIERLLKEFEPDLFSSLVVFDADTVPDAAFLQESVYALQSGAKVLQGRYDLLKQNQSWRTRLLYSAFILYNHIRPLGRAALGLSDGLRGNGMVFKREVLEQIPWQAFSIIEDVEYTNRLALAGLRVLYVPQARVYSQAAATSKQATSQRMRWEGGRWKQAKQSVPPLMRKFLSTFDWVSFDRAFDMLIPPLALLVIGLIFATLLSSLLLVILGGALLGLIMFGWLFLLIGVCLFVFGGLLVGRAPLYAYTALLFAPVYILWKLPLYIKMFFQRAPQQWVRTDRAKIEITDFEKEVNI